jgi:hypothetical protein
MTERALSRARPLPHRELLKALFHHPNTKNVRNPTPHQKILSGYINILK